MRIFIVKVSFYGYAFLTMAAAVYLWIDKMMLGEGMVWGTPVIVCMVLHLVFAGRVGIVSGSRRRSGGSLRTATKRPRAVERDFPSGEPVREAAARGVYARRRLRVRRSSG